MIDIEIDSVDYDDFWLAMMMMRRIMIIMLIKTKEERVGKMIK